MLSPALQKQQEATIRKANEKRKKDQAIWLENERNGVWQAACDKPEFRTEEEIYADFLKDGFQ